MTFDERRAIIEAELDDVSKGRLRGVIAKIVWDFCSSNVVFDADGFRLLEYGFKESEVESWLEELRLSRKV